MELRLTEQEALALYRIILRWDELGSLTTEVPLFSLTLTDLELSEGRRYRGMILTKGEML